MFNSFRKSSDKTNVLQISVPSGQGFKLAALGTLFSSCNGP